jgi:hypothetical protein
LLLRRVCVLLVPLAAVAAPGAMGGCIGQGASPDASADQSVAVPGPDASFEDGENDASTNITSAMRLANMSPDLGPVDFCWRVTGSGAFTGPVLGGSIDAGAPPATDGAGEDGAFDAGDVADSADGAIETADADGAAEPEASDDASALADASDATTDAADATLDGGGVTTDAGGARMTDGGAIQHVGFGQASDVETLPAIGTLDIALVAPYQLSCTAPRFVGRVTLDPGKVATVVIMGLKTTDAPRGSALQLKAFTDEPPGETAHVRIIHAALGSGSDGTAPPLSVQAGNVLIAPEVDPGDAAATSASPAVDTLGYAPAPAFSSPAPIELGTLDDAGDASARTWTTPFFDLGILPGTSHTGFVVSLGRGALGVVWCGDPLLETTTAPCVLETAR